MDALLKSPLDAFHRAAGARLVPFAGWEMPVQYRGIIEEHKAVRTSAGLFDASHMGEVLLTGPEAAAFLDHVLSNDVSRLPVGKALYALLCAEDGGIVDDVILLRLGEIRYLLVVNASNRATDVAWLRAQMGSFELRLEDVSDQYALLALQGPSASAILAKLPGSEAFTALPRFGCAEGSLAGLPVVVSRTGYTGEDGFEIYLAPAAATDLARTLVEAGTPLSLQLAGLGARDSLRLEAGLPLYGHEISRSINPLEAGLGRFVKLEKAAAFLGQEALRTVATGGPRRRIVHFLMADRRIAREGTPLFQEDRPVGQVVSGSYSPLLERGIGSALVVAETAGRPLAVQIREQLFPIEIVPPPLHRRRS